MFTSNLQRMALALAGACACTLAAPAYAAAVFFGPTAYHSTADIPAGFYGSGSPTFLDNLEDDNLGGGLTGSAGAVLGPLQQLGGFVDSVDADNGPIDGSGSRAHSWFSGAGASGVRFSFGVGLLPTAFGLVWTDGGGAITFSAMDGNGNSLGSQVFSGFPDASIIGTTDEDRFFGVQFANGIKSIFISNSSGGIEVDHIQYGAMPSTAPSAVPEPATWALVLGAMGLLGFGRRQRQR